MCTEVMLSEQAMNPKLVLHSYVTKHYNAMNAEFTNSHLSTRMNVYKLWMKCMWRTSRMRCLTLPRPAMWPLAPRIASVELQCQAALSGCRVRLQCA